MFNIFKKCISVNKYFLAIVVVILLSAGCSSTPPPKEETSAISQERLEQINENVARVKKEVNGLIALAESNQKKAASVGGEWRDIDKFIAKGKKFQANGQCEKAIKILQKAIIQGEMGYKQAMAQKQLKMPKYFSF